MALIKCPECGHSVSDRAPRCPECGASIATTAQTAARTAQSETLALFDKEPKPTTLANAFSKQHIHEACFSATIRNATIIMSVVAAAIFAARLLLVKPSDEYIIWDWYLYDYFYLYNNFYIKIALGVGIAAILAAAVIAWRKDKTNTRLPLYIGIVTCLTVIILSLWIVGWQGHIFQIAQSHSSMIAYRMILFGYLYLFLLCIRREHNYVRRSVDGESDDTLRIIKYTQYGKLKNAYYVLTAACVIEAIALLLKITWL